MPSSPLPAAAARGPRRLRSPHRARPPARPLARSPAGPAGPRRPTPSRADGALGGGEEEEGSAPSRVGRSPGPPPPLRLLLSFTPPPAPVYLRGTWAGGGGARTGPGDNCQLEAPPGGRGVRGGAERKGGGHSAPPAGESRGERQRKRDRRHSRRACVVARDDPAPFGPALLTRKPALDSPPNRRGGRVCRAD